MPYPLVSSTIDAQVPYRNIRPRYDETNYGSPTLDTGSVNAVKPLPKFSEENLVDWQHSLGASV